MSTTVLGLNCFHADAAAAIVRDGQVVAAAEEERFNRIKHSAGFPLEAVRYCLKEAGLELGELSALAVAMKPIEHVQDEVLQILSGRPSYSRQIQKRLDAVARFRDVRGILAREHGLAKDDVPKLVEIPHQMAHVASAYYTSGQPEAALLSVDGFGDFCSTYLAHGQDGQIKVLETVLFPHSLGILFTMVTQFLGFGRYGDEGKVMGLAALGEPVYRERLLQVVRLLEDGLFELDPSYFTHPVHGIDMIWEDRVPHTEDTFSERMIEVFGPPRHRYADLTVRDKDLAASVERVLEEGLLHVAKRLKTLLPGAETLCYSGTVALNCVANDRLRRDNPFGELWIAPATSDAGTALGCALAASQQLGAAPPVERLGSARLGPHYDRAEVEAALEGSGLQFTRNEAIHDEVAALIDQGKVVAWFRGRQEYGSRALGGRSILADPRRQDMREILNARVKFREAFRPFAASILEDRLGDYLVSPSPSPFMQYAAAIKDDKQAEIPAVVNVDGTCRYQSVAADADPDFARLLQAFAAKTGTPILLNTSFNENEPIVCTPADAIDCFVSSKMDALALGDYLVRR